MRPSPSTMRLLCLALALLCVERAAAGSLSPIGGGTLRKRSMAEQQPEFASDRVIVSFKPDVVRAMAAEEEGLKFQKPAGLQGALVYSIEDNATVAEKIKQLEHHPAVALVEPDYKVKVFWDPNNPPDDPNYSQEWHIPKISAMGAWQYTTGSSEVKVCHVDSGVRIDHPDLAQNVLKGWNFVPAGQVEGTSPPRAGTPDYFNYNDTYGHGTHTAGIIGAVGNNALGIAGLNWKVKLLVCRFIWNDGSGYVSDAMNCIKLCRQEGAMITSNSWGGIGYSSFLEREIASTQAAGQLFVVASGNSGVDLDAVPLYPTSYKTDNMISVASSGASDYVSTFSNLGVKTVHMLAPGEAIFSTFMDGGYKQMWGTSMACPMVAGTAALLQAQAMSRGVTLGYADLKKLIIDTVDKVPDGADKVITGGRLNVTAAMLALETMLNERGAPPAGGQPAGGQPAIPPGDGGSGGQEPTVVSPPPDSPVSPPLPSPSPTPAAAPGKVCGGSPLAGLNSASQSSTSGTSKANLAIDGDCIKRRLTQGSCAQTLYEPNPWWAVKLASARPVISVSVQTTSECACVADLVGARILVGSQPWEGPASAANFSLCAGISGIVRGQRKSFVCATGPDGSAPRMTSQLPWYALATGASGAVCGIAKTAQGDAGADLYCWGSGRNGLFGVASTANYSATPIKVAWPDVPQAGDRPPNGGEIWYGVSIGARSACAVSASNQLYCWGLNDHGELGSGSTSPAGEVVREARRVGTSEMTFWDVSVGDGFACATGEYNGTWGKLWCWGSNEALQLGIADASLLQGTSTGGTNSVAGSSVNGFSANPLEIPLPSQLVDGGWHLLECGSTACCATAAAGDGPAYCWGGPFSSPTRRAPQAVPGGRRYKSDTLVAPFDVSAGDGAAQTQMACGTDIDDGYTARRQQSRGMANKKRGRADELPEGVQEALDSLSQTLDREGTEQKMRALERVAALIDAADETYSVQRALVAGDAAFYLTELLSDPAPHVAVRAAEAVAALCRHSAPARARLAGGPLMGLDSKVERVSLNPVQSDLVDSGAMAALVPMLLQRQEATREAALEAISALCSFNQDGKLAQLEGLVQALQQQPDLTVQIFEHLDVLVSTMECGSDEAAQQLDLLHAPLLAQLRQAGRPQAAVVALSLLATLCEQRPEAAEDLRQQGAVAAVAPFLLNGSSVLQDSAARALWLLIKGDRKCLAREEGLLGCDPLQLAGQLIALIETAEAEEARVQRDLDDLDGGGSGYASGSDEDARPLAPAVTPTAADICHAEEAGHVLKALAVAHPEVQTLLDARDVPLARTSSGCCIC
ncbi:peptidase S8 isoform A [Chlorella sorokiniana]|uniref:Peptidase S8 isoform A n=1 Tax=Chlorella sorokiniana TaxID=3076 RepID=A0A2P6TE83_CHLSO|nr:peptidase S8 isoform A [Chlorella sorokiniana]|eukprot:PRW20948.1 peptidase S8 isoform A [Chlorella sorokiniana]